MIKRLTCACATIAVAGGIALGAPGVASAAHCADSGAPGNSDYSAHVRATNGPGAHDEGDHKGYSTCNENSRNYEE